MVSMALLLAEPPALRAALRLAAAGPAKSSQGQWPPPQHSLSLWLTSLTHPQTLTGNPVMLQALSAPWVTGGVNRVPSCVQLQTFLDLHPDSVSLFPYQ